MRRELLIIIGFILLIRVPFLNQAVQGDDIYYLQGAQHALIEPLHPNRATYAFQGEMVSMQGHPHPPLNAWFLAALLAIWKEVYEAPFHAAYIVFSLIAALSMWSLARRFSDRPLWATLLFLATPAFVINGNSFESDLPFLAFWMAGIALFIVAVDRRSILLLLPSAAALALASLAALQAIAVVPVLAVYLWMNARTWKPGWLAALTAPVVLGIWQLFEKSTGGALPATVLAGYFSTYGLQQFHNKLKNAAALTGHLAWIVFPILTASAFRVKWIWIVVAAAVGIAIDFNPLFWVSFALGVALIVWCAQHREFLTLWILIFFATALIIFFAGSARYLLPIAAPVAILASRERRWIVPAFVCEIAVALALAFVNYQHWDGYRRIANTLPNGDAHKRVWIDGEWGLRYYLESKGALPVLRGQAVRPGDLVVSSELSHPVPVTSGGGRLAPLSTNDVTSVLPLRLIGVGSKSGYSTASAGFRPFDIVSGPIDRVQIDAVIERTPATSDLLMNAPEADQQIVSGIYEVESTWRWMSAKGVVLLKPPPQPQRLQVRLNIPDAAPARHITVSLDGKPMGEATYPSPGSYTFTSEPVSGSTVTITADKTFSTPGDHRQLGIILSEVGFR